MAISSSKNADRQPDADGAERLQAAVDLARTEPTDARWVTIENDLLDRILAVSRPAHPVQGHTEHGAFSVSEHVVRSHVLAAADEVPGCEVDAIAIHTDAQARCAGITLVITACYGLSLLALADRVRSSVASAVPLVLGAVPPPVAAAQMHVHVHDVTIDDPKRG